MHTYYKFAGMDRSLGQMPIFGTEDEKFFKKMDGGCTSWLRILVYLTLFCELFLTHTVNKKKEANIKTN